MAIKLSYMETSAGNKTILVEWELEAGKCGLKCEQLNLTELCLERE